MFQKCHGKILVMCFVKLLFVVLTIINMFSIFIPVGLLHITITNRVRGSLSYQQTWLILCCSSTGARRWLSTPKLISGLPMDTET